MTAKNEPKPKKGVMWFDTFNQAKSMKADLEKVMHVAWHKINANKYVYRRLYGLDSYPLTPKEYIKRKRNQTKEV